jgi:hypothetical protein
MTGKKDGWQAWRVTDRSNQTKAGTAMRAFDLMKSWGFLEDVCETKQLVYMDVQLRGHEEMPHDRVAVS